MPKSFAVIVGGKLREFDRYEHLPAQFERLVRFIPPIPPAPHTEEQHAAAALWTGRLKALLERERARRLPDR